MSDTASAPAPTEKLLPAADVAIALNLSLTAVYRLVRSGDLPSHRFGKGKVRPRGVRIPESAVEAYLNGTLTTPTVAPEEAA
ncbi:helix-turn-helix transcriptional regulator [Streptomyces sp. NPDC052773]|uniref:helix-turn-helix transcriptional regulator n=1 Tax=Streptomyces sp. NPDC052773 TaxID=3365693 RepID=UPI0037CF293C